MARKKRISKKLQQERYFMMYVSGAYEEVYIQYLHKLLHEQCHITLHVRSYQGGEDFGSGFEMLDKDLKGHRVTKNLDRAEAILIQGDMDVKTIVTRMQEFEKKTKKYKKHIYLIKSIHSFESWVKAHFIEITSQNEIVQKSDIEQWISNYSTSVEHAKRYFETHLDLKHIMKAAHPKTGNQSFRQFIEKIDVLECITDINHTLSK